MEPAGLSEQEARARRERGLGNHMPPPTGRTYFQIVRENVFTFINGAIFALGLALLVLGQWSDCLVSVAVVAVNVLVGVVQEVRAKRILDHVAVLTRPTARVVRDESERDIDPADIVVGDLLVIRAGDQVIVDGIVREGRLEADESLLSGESDLVTKSPGGELYSGTFCVSGAAKYEATRVGDELLAHRITEGARAFRRIYTPLQRHINQVVRIILFVAASFGAVLVAGAILRGLPPVEVVRIAIVVVGLVPNGLFLAIAAAYAMGAVRIAGRGALVQQANAVESLSNVDMLCLDKTGTLTSGQLELVRVHAVGMETAEATRLLGDFATSMKAANATSRAIAAAAPGARLSVVEEVPFASDRRWSGLLVGDEERRHALVLGAPDSLAPNVCPEKRAEVDGVVERNLGEGFRVLLFARRAGVERLRDEEGAPSLPDALAPVALLSLRDELRPDVSNTLSAFGDAGITLKVISGDHPATARAVALQAGVPVAGPVVLGRDLGSASPEELRRLAHESTVFARVAPHEKALLVGALHQSGRYVAMIGDGVNDVPSLKRADLAISFRGGTQAARAVADLVLLDDSFTTLPLAFREGQRILHGMQDVLRLFMTRIIYMALLIVAVGLVGAGFPFTPKQNALLALFTVGIPAIALAAWAPPAPIPRHLLMPSLVGFVVPAGWSLALLGFGWYLSTFVSDGALRPAQSALTTLSFFCGSALILFASAHSAERTNDPPIVRRRRPIAVVAATLVAFVLIAADERASAFFELGPVSAMRVALAGLLAIAWALLLRWMLRARVMERVFGLQG